MTIDRAIFFRGVRQTLFSGLLRQHQVEGMTALLDLWEARLPASDPRWLAYMLATAHHETGATMQPVRETFAASDDRAIAIAVSSAPKGSKKTSNSNRFNEIQSFNPPNALIYFAFRM